MEDEKIIDLYWERSERAIAETERKYGAYCRNIATHILYNQEDSEECVNDTYLRAWNAMPKERPAILSAFLGAKGSFPSEILVYGQHYRDCSQIFHE